MIFGKIGDYYRSMQNVIKDEEAEKEWRKRFEEMGKTVQMYIDNEHPVWFKHTMNVRGKLVQGEWQQGVAKELALGNHIVVVESNSPITGDTTTYDVKTEDLIKWQHENHGSEIQ